MPTIGASIVTPLTASTSDTTGAVVQEPLFLNEGDVVKVDTRTGEYLGRVAAAGA